MFFEDKIKSILPGDQVLEIGPGATPYYRSDVFLEKIFDTEQELIAQSGNVGILSTQKKVVYYSGDVFPFKNNEFDYVICSHVLEHVDDIDKFVKEIQRVGKKGYIEFPLIYYDYLYNFPEHTQFVFFRNNCIFWMPKTETALNTFSDVQKLFYKSCDQKYYRIIDDFKKFFFQGFEWFDIIETKRVSDLSMLTYQADEFDFSFLTIKDNFPSKGIFAKFKILLLKTINKV